MNPVARPLFELCERRILQCDPKETPTKEFFYIDISSVDNRTKRIISPKRINGSEASVRARQIVCAKDVLISTVRPNLNTVATVDAQEEGHICSTGFCVLRCGPDLDPDYLFAFVQSQQFITSLSEIVQGALYPAVTERQVLAQKIPWIPKKQQKQIGTMLLSQLEQIANATNATNAQINELAKLSVSILSESIAQSKATITSLGDSLCEIKHGIGANWAKYPVLGATRQGLAPAKEQPGKTPQRYKPAFPGTVFYNPMRIMIGSIAFVDDDDTPGITSPDYVVLRGKPGVTDSRWFYHWLRSPLGEQCISSLARGAVRERMLFNRLAEGEIELPDFPAQERASKALAAIKPMRTAIANQLKELELMPKKLLAQVFES